MVKKVFIDTNVWLRFLLKDEKNQLKPSRDLIKLAEEGKIRPYTSAIVLLEINYVLSKIYRISLARVQTVIGAILSTRNLVIIDKTNFKRAFFWHKKYKVKLPDCLIVSSLPQNCMLITWDKELTKLKFAQSVSPSDFLTSNSRQ